MSIFKRIQDIVSANLNDLIEGYEHPEQMLRQAIREMEEAIHRAQPDAARAIANEKTIAKELVSNEARSATWHSRAPFHRPVRKVLNAEPMPRDLTCVANRN
jgi:phage shock protein A